MRRLLSNVWKAMKLTWDEWHMIASGWGDGVALNRGEKIPTIQETTEDYDETDFYSILAREAWYYKVGVALGRLTWAIIGAIVLVRVLG